ncbi:MAG: ribosomal large subunit pseudouridine synthase, RluD subfamily protein nonfunctional [Candidatus Saccharibacteria bacterium]|nr:ribosomal large subunit pseudouridine synthase, RluD subfamily protein nonfunctional [Candidatus Saccharibacteria bacterium]
MQEFIVGPEDSGTRADVYIAKNYPDYTRSSLERLFDNGMVTLEGEPIKAGYKLKGKEIISVDESKLRAEPAVVDLPVLYEDDNVVVINKPEGFLTHSKGALNEESTVASFLKPKINDNALTGNRAGIVHRLDRGTSGVLIGAKNSETLSRLQKQFSQRKTKKIYTAVVEGVPEPAEALIDAPIGRNPKRPQSFRVDASGKAATTQYKVLNSVAIDGKTYSLVELRPATGRTHQIRVHMAYIGHPVVGDHVYGHDGEHLLLHAASLEITLPTSERRVFSAPLPGYFNNFLPK